MHWRRWGQPNETSSNMKNVCWIKAHFRLRSTLFSQLLGIGGSAVGYLLATCRLPVGHAVIFRVLTIVIYCYICSFWRVTSTSLILNLNWKVFFTLIFAVICSISGADSNRSAAPPSDENNSFRKTDPDFLLAVCWYLLPISYCFRVIHENSFWPLQNYSGAKIWIESQIWLPISDLTTLYAYLEPYRS